MARLEGTGVAIELPDGRWCARHLLVRLHAASRASRRRRVEPTSIADFVRFLAEWQHVAHGSRVEGRAGVLAVVEQLQGIEIPAGDWESKVLPARVRDYNPRWLDELCLGGEVAWGRLTPRPEREAASPPRRGATTPSPATPLALVVREDLPWLLDAVRLGEEPGPPEAGSGADVLDVLGRHGASFRADLPGLTGRLPAEVDEGLWDLVARGIVTADAFSAVRVLLGDRRRARTPARRRVGGIGLASRRAPVGSGVGEGRWSLLPTSTDPTDALAGRPGGTELEELAEAVAWQLLTRWGVVAWEVWARESFKVPWRVVVRALRRLEARGLAMGGRFVAGLSGEQYAAGEAAELLWRIRRDTERGRLVEVAAADPLNVTGSVVPGPRVPAVRHRTVVFRDGTPVATPA
jgi:ATP-dependent Lhr-like helicase